MTSLFRDLLKRDGKNLAVRALKITVCFLVVPNSDSLRSQLLNATFSSAYDIYKRADLHLPSAFIDDLLIIKLTTDMKQAKECLTHFNNLNEIGTNPRATADHKILAYRIFLSSHVLSYTSKYQAIRSSLLIVSTLLAFMKASPESFRLFKTALAQVFKEGKLTSGMKAFLLRLLKKENPDLFDEFKDL